MPRQGPPPWYTEVTDHWEEHKITYPPREHPSEQVARKYAQECVDRRKGIEIAVKNPHGLTVLTLQSVEPETPAHPQPAAPAPAPEAEPATVA